MSQLGSFGYSYISINSVIADSSHKIGLRVSGNDPGEGGVTLGGNQSNTFTGNVEVSGRRNHLNLDKGNRAIAVRGDILVKDRALIRFAQSNQTLGTSTITLKNYGVLQSLSVSGSDIKNKFKKLIIEDNGIVHFNHSEGKSERAKYYIYFDDLITNQGGHLKIQDWKEGRDFLLVRKSSANLNDSLTKMSFVGYDRNNIHLEDFDGEYWSVSATPEPTTYGAILGAVGLGLCAWRRKYRKTGHLTRH